jgi:hypothetical protein
MNNTTKKRLNEAMKKKWEYQTEVFTFHSWEQIDDSILIATDKRTITVDDDMVDMFLAGLIDVGAKKTDILKQRSKHTNLFD